MKEVPSITRILSCIVLCSLTHASIIKLDQPKQIHDPKESLRKKLVRENKKWERELSLGGRLSASKSMGSRWGINALNKRFAHERGNDLISSSILSKKVNLMALNRKVFEFIGGHGIMLKGESDKGNSVKFALHPSKLNDKVFNVKIGKQGDKYAVHFLSKSPYISKSIKVYSENDLNQKVTQFLSRTLKSWKKMGERRLSLTPSKNTKKNRKLLKKEDIPDIMTEMAGEAMELKPEDGKEDSFDLIAKEDEAVIAKVSIKAGEEGGEVLEMSNEEIPQFKHMQKVANRTIGDQDQKEDLELFFRPHFEEFLDKYNNWKLGKADIQEIAQFINEEAQKVGYIGQLETTEVKAKEELKMIVLRKWKEQGHSVFFQANVYNINDDYMGVHIIQGNNEMEMEIPATMNHSQKQDTKTAIAMFMTQRDFSDMVDFKEAKILFKKTIDVMGCEKVKTEQDNENSALFLVEEDKNCPFSGNSFVLSNVDFDGMRYIHLILDNNYFTGEHFVTMTTKNIFNDNLTKVLKDSKAEIATVEEAYKKSQDPVTVSMEDIEKTVKEAFGNKVTESHKGNLKMYKAKVYGREKEVVRIREFTKDDQPTLFKVTTFDVNVDGEVKQARAHHEFLLYASNGYNQLDVLKHELDKISADIPV
jgi:hypothetical protein